MMDGTDPSKKQPLEDATPSDSTTTTPKGLNEAVQQARSFFKIDLSPLVEGWGRLEAGPSVVLDERGSSVDGMIYRICLSDFQKIKEVGRGSHGVVTAVFHQPSKTIMALKEIRVELASQDIKNILIELDVLSKSQSPYIIKFYGAFYTRSSVFLALELMEIGSLSRLIRWTKAAKIAIPEQVLLAISYSVIRGLEFLVDRLSIMHRDIKPTNIVLGRAGQVKLCDFGVSGKLVQSLARSHVGTAAYMAPERITMASEPRHYNSRADVWSLGASIYEAATGSSPYPPAGYDSPFAHLMAILSDPAPSLPEDGDRFSESFRSFIASCLTKDVAERPGYTELLQHPALAPFVNESVRPEEILASWIAKIGICNNWE